MEPYVPPVHYTRRWFCYLDLLGFSDLVMSKSIDRVLPLYEKALARVRKNKSAGHGQGISYSWFSDTFIIFSRSDSAQDFASLEQSGRLLFQFLVRERIPVRGAISCDNLYTQLERNVFIGPALIEAYRYGEGQNWLGLSLAPSATRRMSEIGLPPEERPHYRLVEDKSVLKDSICGPLYAFAFNNGSVNGRSPYLAALQAMRLAATSSSVADKYDRTIRFLEKHYRPINGRLRAV